MKKRITMFVGIIALLSTYTVQAQESEVSSFDKDEAQQELTALSEQLEELQNENADLQSQLSEIEEAKASIAENDSLYQTLTDKALQFVEVYVPEDTSLEVENRHDVFRAEVAPFVTTELLNEIAPTGAEVEAKLSEATETMRQNYDMYTAKIIIENYVARVDPATIGTDEVIVAVDVVKNVTNKYFLNERLSSRLVLTMIPSDGEWLISDIDDISLSNMEIE
jgi:hypothetical protein